MEKHRLRMLERSVPSKIFGLKRHGNSMRVRWGKKRQENIPSQLAPKRTYGETQG
jgi:hypothetical protein